MGLKMWHRNSLLTASSSSSNIEDNLLVSLTDKVVTLLRLREMFVYDLRGGMRCVGMVGGMGLSEGGRD